MVLQYLHPGCVEAEPAPGFPTVLGWCSAPCRQIVDWPLVMRTLPFLVDGAEFYPNWSFFGCPILAISRRSIGKEHDPILQEIALGIGLNIRPSCLRVMLPSTLGLEVIVLAAVEPETSLLPRPPDLTIVWPLCSIDTQLLTPFSILSCDEL